MEPLTFIKDLLEAVNQLDQRKLWRRFTNYDCFGVRIIGQEQRLLGVILGNAGQEYGLSLFRGPHVVASLAGLLDSEGPGDDAVDGLDMIGFSMEPFESLPPEAQALLCENGRTPGHRDRVPNLLAKPSGCQGRLPNESELSLLLLVIRAVVEADRSQALLAATLDDDEGICVLNIAGDARDPRLTVTQERWEQETAAMTVPLFSAGQDLAHLPRLRATWLVGLPALPAAIEGDDRAMQMLLVVDEASEMILQGRPVFAGQTTEAVTTLVDTFQGKGMTGVKGLPNEIICSSRRLCDAMAPVLKPLGVRCTYSASIPLLQMLIEQFYDVVDGGDVPVGDTGGPVDDEEEPIPAANDLMGWKRADNRLFHRFADHFENEDRLWSSRAVKRYFGDDDLDYYIGQHEPRGVVQAYTAWGILDYRPQRNSMTHAEKMLEGGLPEPEAILLRARMQAHPSLYRVAGHDPKAGTLDLEDVLLGGGVTVHDKLMAENIHDNWFLTARTFPAGDFHFIEMAGPPLGAGMGTEAVEFLRYSGMKFTTQGLRDQAHTFGRLWDWFDRWQANRQHLRLQNTDGEAFLWHTASFSVAEPDLTAQRLTERTDVDYDEEADEWVWSKNAKGNSRVVGETVSLGRIELIGDELVLTVNSAKRFERARKWLEELPGIIFKDVQVRPWDEAAEDRPLDKRIAPPEPVEMTPELTDSLKQMMNKHYMDWLDKSLPVLNGKTPRQACQTKAGRQGVAMLIRTMPDPSGPAPIRVPRLAMFGELGMAEEAARQPSRTDQRPQPPIPIEEISQKPKVPRNAPCPCGSGRKYKKCCGRSSQLK